MRSHKLKRYQYAISMVNPTGVERSELANRPEWQKGKIGTATNPFFILSKFLKARK